LKGKHQKKPTSEEKILLITLITAIINLIKSVIEILSSRH